MSQVMADMAMAAGPSSAAKTGAPARDNLQDPLTDALASPQGRAPVDGPTSSASLTQLANQIRQEATLLLSHPDTVQLGALALQGADGLLRTAASFMEQELAPPEDERSALVARQALLVNTVDSISQVPHQMMARISALVQAQIDKLWTEIHQLDARIAALSTSDETPATAETEPSAEPTTPKGRRKARRAKRKARRAARKAR